VRKSRPLGSFCFPAFDGDVALFSDRDRELVISLPGKQGSNMDRSRKGDPSHSERAASTPYHCPRKGKPAQGP